MAYAKKYGTKTGHIRRKGINTVVGEFSKEEQALLQLLKSALTGEKYRFGEDADKNHVLALAKKHAVIPFLYDAVEESDIPNECMEKISAESRRTVLQSYRLLFLTKQVSELLKEHGIEFAVLKGIATASLYKIPELRKSGDVDLLLLHEEDEKKAESILLQAGFTVSSEQHANHHTVFVSPDGIDVEVHTMLAEPFAYKKINAAMEAQMPLCKEHVIMTDSMGVMIPVLDKPFHAYELLLHMLQHFVYAGFGLKLLCDWVIIWNYNWTEEEKMLYKQLVEESEIAKFAEAVTAVCSKYLGLNKENYAYVSDESMADVMLREVLDAEDMGWSASSRMVMMSGTGLWAYVKEFHHQMHLNFPKAGKCFLFWPVLWVVTLVRFLKNNRKVRNTSTGAILKEAAKRSKLMEELKLFR